MYCAIALVEWHGIVFTPYYYIFGIGMTVSNISKGGNVATL
jgi:hypothetical protein